MQIEATRDFRRPRAQVLAKFRDPARFETVMADIGAQTRRQPPPADLAWHCTVTWRDAPRALTIEIAEPAPHETMTLTARADLGGADVTFDFYDLPDGGCRVIARADLHARSLIARAALQSVRLVRGRAEDRLGRFVALMGRP